MDKFQITGGRPLEGCVAISGAKNAALPAMTAALLTDQRVILNNLPRVRDISTLRNLLEDLGVDSSVTHEAHGNRIDIEARQLLNPVAPYELVKQMRASVLVLGPLVARFGHARVSLPAAPLASVPSISTSRGSQNSGRPSTSNTVTSTRGQTACAGQISASIRFP